MLRAGAETTQLSRRRAHIALFTVIFYGSKNFGCKITQFCATRRESQMVETPSVSNTAQADETHAKVFLEL
jgi:hypothetical protein